MSRPASDTGLGFWEVTAIGVGGMVGGGIFAVLGLSVKLAEGGAPLAFLLAGVVALVTAYAYARLSVHFPSQGGTVAFLDRAFGPGLPTGSANILLWMSYIVMLSVYAHAFGSYGASLLPEAWQAIGRPALISASVAVITGLNLLNARLIGAAEDWIVLVKILILLVFVGVGLWQVEPGRLAPAQWASPLALVAGGMIIFLAYEGFELIANTAEDVRDPARTLPRAYFAGVGFVVLLYILVAVVTAGTLPVDRIVAAQDYALAEAARPFFGPAGFGLIAVAAMLSTASAINATLYGSARLSYVIAKDGELPAVLERKVWGEPVEGLLITAVLTLLLANFVDLSSLSLMGSAGFLLIFAAVNAANVKLAAATGSRRWISVAGIGLCVAALACLLGYTALQAAWKLGILAAMLAAAVAIEWSFRAWSGRRLNLRAQAPPESSDPD